MPEYKQKTKAKAADEVEQTEPAELETDIDVDELLDEIDEVLEENAEEFVKAYIQKGGQ